MARIYLNIDLLTLPLFTKRPVGIFLLHWLAWISLYFIAYLPTAANSPKIPWEYVFFTYGILSSINFLLFFAVAFFIVPRLAINQKRWFWAVFICIVLTFLFCYLKFRLEHERSDRLLHQSMFRNSAGTKTNSNIFSLGFFSYYFRTYAQVNIFTTFSIIILAFAYRLLLAFFLQQRISKELENQKLQAELSFLKMQINPHFLFNALNNIYSLTVIEKGKKSGDSVLKLAEMMRYVLYEKEDEENKVPLDKEIKQLNNHIDLEKLRHAKGICLNFSIEGDTAEKRVAPLLLFPFLENAFKHGVLTNPQKPITMQLKVTADRLYFSIENTKNNFQKDKVGGIGIQNVKKRLSLIYQHSYSINIREKDEDFCVELSLPL